MHVENSYAQNQNANLEPVLEAWNISKTFFSGPRRVKALREVSLKIQGGEVTGLIGPDGSGKTTFLRLAAGLLLPDSGQIKVLGCDTLHDAQSIQAAIGYMPQRFGLYEDLTVQENLDLYADMQGVPYELRPERYKELMQMTGLGPFKKRLAGRLSGGMKQKLGLACTLVKPQQLLFLDEPTVGVDPLSRRELWQIVNGFVAEKGTSVLLSTAYLDEAERCDDVILMHEGHVLATGPPDDFSRQVEGRTFRAHAPGLKKRHLQTRMVQARGVLDAIIQGDGVRLIMEKSGPPEVRTLFPEDANVQIRSVPPRFEDSFITKLKKSCQDRRPTAGVTKGTSRSVKTRGKPMITVENLDRRFGDFYAVKGISFEISAGEIFGLLGANGAGKTTTFRMLCGLLPATGGRLQVAGANLRTARAAARARIGYMAQKFSLYANLTVQQNLEFFSRAYGLKPAERRERIIWAIEQFELTSVAGQNSGILPLGYRQRLQMACALMHRPDILFLDEPTSGVDPLARRKFWSRINSLAEEGVTVLVTTHFMEEAEYCDRLAIMAAGQMLAMGTSGEIIKGVHTSEGPAASMEDAFINIISNTMGEQT